MASFGVDDALLITMQPGARYVTRATTVAVAPLEAGRDTWIATVVAETLVSDSGGGYTEAPPSRFGVALQRRDGEMAVLGLPAPLGSVEPRIRLTAATGEVTDAQRQTVQGFLAAWLGRTDAVSRWAVGAAADLPQPLAHDAITVDRMWAAPDKNRVVTVVSATDVTGLRVSYEMTISLVDVDGTPMVDMAVPGAVTSGSSNESG